MKKDLFFFCFLFAFFFQIINIEKSKNISLFKDRLKKRKINKPSSISSLKPLTGHIMYMGKDKYENEDLLKFGFPEDVWFHVDDLSSAHVYLRLKDDETVEQFSDKAKDECCQLVKENSIEG